MNFKSGKLKIGISSCLLGEPVRYNGKDKHNQTVINFLGERFEAVSVCPELEMGVPREPVQLVAGGPSTKIVGVDSGKDWTEAVTHFNARILKELKQQNLSGFIFKSRSPSCGTKDIPVYNEGEQVDKSAGLFAHAFMKHFPNIPVIDEEALQDETMRKEFIARVIKASL
jgi:uncharacterized protein YbbK (DUF523 family)